MDAPFDTHIAHIEVARFLLGALISQYPFVTSELCLVGFATPKQTDLNVGSIATPEILCLVLVGVDLIAFKVVLLYLLLMYADKLFKSMLVKLNFYLVTDFDHAPIFRFRLLLHTSHKAIEIKLTRPGLVLWC